MFNSTVSINKRIFFALVASFLVVAPASVSSHACASQLKILRIGILGAAFLVGLRWFRVPSLKELSGKFLLLGTVYWLAAIWSTSPMWGLLYKGMLVCSICAAISLARSLRTDHDFRQLCRNTTTAAIVGLAVLAFLIFAVGDYSLWKGRLTVSGMNANTLGISAAIFALLSLLHLLIGDGIGWKSIAVGVIACMAVLVVYSGSRAAVLVLLAGGGLLLPVIARNKSQAVLLAAVSVGVIGSFSLVWLGDREVGAGAFSESDGSLRLLTELTKDTRIRLWSKALRTWYENDLAIGKGWLHANNKPGFIQSSYLQILNESGLLGLTCMVIFFGGTMQTLTRAIRLARRASGFQSTCLYLFSAVLFAISFHGVFESALLVGTAPNALLLAFSATQLDLLLQRAPARSMKRAQVNPRIPNMRSRIPGKV